MLEIISSLSVEKMVIFYISPLILPPLPEHLFTKIPDHLSPYAPLDSPSVFTHHGKGGEILIAPGGRANKQEEHFMDKSCRLMVVIMALFFLAPGLGGAADAQQPASRFVAAADGTVLDTATGLMWAATDNGADIDWTGAEAYCATFRAGGHADWRLPTLTELDTLFDRASEARFKVFAPITLTGCCPWTADSRRNRARSIFFMTGEINTFDKNVSSSMRALPVRAAR
jgi:hypothetical protein